MRIDKFGVGLHGGGLRTFIFIFGRAQVEVGNHLVGIEHLLSFERLAGYLLGSLGSCHSGTRHFHGGLVGHLVDYEKHLPFFHLCAFIHAHLRDGTRHLGAHFHVL